ncbi:uncharacterized protein KQ657_002612 [Scheffersomyces spartinae]|uniref:NTF2 domain-containing protein n=1 Tax=Scheffersomyces spartinae TaxID=45513 RepID=A0A9P7V604_9ASCO|nr:uncharacterized protein KQ657_002612 [Scheffersomyces spartinae]KAG7192004.1 hypothetical protein KQ657_002612 [Scheffersomyces spartinae]
MTTSPSEIEELQIDRATSVGWLFVQSYYDMYNKNYENFHMFYHVDGSLSHSEFPEAEEEGDGDKKASDSVKTVLKATGKEGIKARFLQDGSLKLKNNSIVVTSADFQVSLKKNILIVVSGEWSRNGSPYWQFNQTFLLTPGRKANSYDVANDVLKFVDFKEFDDDKEVVKAMAETTTAKEEKEKEDESEKELEKPKKSEVMVPETTKKVESESQDEPKKERKETEPSTVSVPSTSDTTETTATTSETTGSETTGSETTATSETTSGDTTATTGTSTSETTPTTTTKSDPKQPISWAALASRAAEKEGAAPAVAKTTKTNSATPVAVGAPTATKKTTTPETTIADKKGNGKDDWFPIYIRGIKNLDENVVKNYLVDNFGSVLLFKPLVNIALCDFATEEGQRRALEAGKATIDGITFDLEKRESKRDNNNGGGINGAPFSSNGKKGGKDLKDKQQQQQLGDNVKRTKNDKKNPKKRPGVKHPEAF